MCTVQDPGKNVTYFEGATPILPVADLKESIKYYVRVLGFKLKWETPVFASVGRGRCDLMLAESDQGHPGTWVWIGVGDAGLLCEEYCAKRARIRHPPTNYTWAYEMQVSDLDGNVLRMGSEPRANAPIGPWLDMDGISWTPSADGGWKRTDAEAQKA
jgi:catechol 2,3-dioxygenase-like lactoylglutathione lyase family enzyme